MKLKSLLLRYYPPGIMLEYEKGGELKTKSIDLLELSPSTDVNTLVEEIQKAEPLITVSRAQQVRLLVQRLQEKLRQHCDHSFYLFKVLRAHILPLTNVALNKAGSCFITGSYDRTCKVWDTASGEELHTLEGHRNVVYAIAFNNPYGFMAYSLKRAHGGLKSALERWKLTVLCVPEVVMSQCHKLNVNDRPGHKVEVSKKWKVCLSFNPQSTVVATGSMDTTAKLWDIQNGEEVVTLTGHLAEIISLSFDTSGDRIITGSFDHTVVVWDASTGRKVHTLIGHCAEISSALFNWDCSLILTGSMDKTCMLWDATSGKCVATLTGHDDEILDSCFDYTGKLIATASADGTARVYDATTRKCITKLEGHEGEISKISFNPQGNRLLTGSSDKTARIWDVQTGQCLQVLEGHTDEIFSCAFNYNGNIVITGKEAV
ncbi:WD repeat-containing protein 69 [Cricetulus griseus]|nr:WD repeat-containing protein 69 [Cricetulus griseus]